MSEWTTPGAATRMRSTWRLVSHSDRNGGDAVSQMPRVGEIAPSFVLPSAGGGEFSLQAFRGRWVVLFFFPKTATPG